MYKSLFAIVASLFLMSSCVSNKQITKVPPEYSQPPELTVKTDRQLETDPPPVKDIGEIGDVKYSILSESDFKNVNGVGWVVMGGQIVDEKWGISAYKEVLLINGDTKFLPDARGMFIRGMDLDNSDGKGNTEIQTVGEYKSDRMKKHKHVVKLGRKLDNCERTENENTYNAYKAEEIDSEDQIEITTGGEMTETRPRNITLYIYIKVDHASKAK